MFTEHSGTKISEMQKLSLCTFIWDVWDDILQ